MKLTDKLNSIIGGTAKKVVDVTSDVLAAPKVFKEKQKQKTADANYKMYKMVNDSKGVADKGNESDPLFRARTMMKDAQRKTW